MISLRGVEVVVPGADEPRTVLHRLNLDLSEHRIGIIGANGSGKSTLLRLLNGLIEPTAGTVSVDGLDTVRQGRQVRRRVGFVFTEPLAQLVMPTPIEDIELSLRRIEPDRRLRRLKAAGILADLGLEALATTSIYDLSGGERQLVALASVLAVNPDVVVADEPTTLLDLRNSLRVRDTLARLPQQVIVATHHLDLLEGYDRVLVVDAARIVFDGPSAEAIEHYRQVATR